MSPDGPPRWAPWLAALTAAMLSAYLKAGMSSALPGFNAADDAGYFHVESALQYRYAKLLAAGDAPPAVDVKAQYPEGLRPGRDVSLLMERATAATYRLLGSPAPAAFHRFVVFWVAAFSSLSVAALFALGLGACGDASLSLACAAAYGVSWAAVSTAAGTYGFQDFALPLLFIALAGLSFVITSEGLKARLGGAVGALSLALALDAWHFSRFFLLTLWAALAYAGWRARREPRARGRLLNGVAWLLFGALAAAVCSGVLRETGFLTSPELMLGGALGLWLWLGPRGAALGAAVTLVSLLLSRGAEVGAYGHVYGLLADKIRFGLIKPEDPGLLSRDARLLWTGPFDSPDAGFLIFSLLPLIFLVVPRFKAEPRAEADPAGDLADGLLALFLFGAILVSRLVVILAFFIAAAPLRRRAARPRWILALAVLVAVMEGLKTLAPQSRLNPFMGAAAALTPADRRPGYAPANERDVLQWLTEHGEGRPVLADFGLSASILAYTPSPVLLQPKFESGPLRQKTAGYLRALYASEDEFDLFCREHGARLFVYSASDLLDETPDGPRYMAAAPPLRDATAAVLFQFHPEALRHFRLVHENEDYRIYQEGEPGTRPPQVAAIYDVSEYHPQHAADGRLVLDIPGVLSRREQARLRVMLAIMLQRMGRMKEAQQAYDQALAIWH